MKTLAASLSILTREGVMLYLLRGVAFTCIISVLGVIMGLIVGSLLALARTYCKKGPARILGWFAAAYIELFRNTPYLLWIFICVVFCPCPGFFARKMFGLTSVEMKLLFKAALALILFNSSVIAEIVRGGIMSIDNGQFEAGRSLGFNYTQTMWYIIMPQAFKNVLPTLGNEFIVLLKETSVAGYIALQDLTKGGDIIRSRTYSAFMPLIAVAIIYLVMVMIFTYFVRLLERRLRSSDH